MSWDIFAVDIPAEFKSAEEIPSDFKPNSLSRASVISRISEIFPSANFSDPSWGLIDGDGWSMEVNLGREENCDGFTLHVRGNDDAAVDAVVRILDDLRIRAFDAQTGEFFEAGPNALKSFREWRTFRDRAVHREHEDS